jgi:predicted dienelactone hydrolase
VALILFFASTTGSAAGLSTTVVESSGGKGRIEALIWSPCSSATSNLRIGPFAFAATKDCALPSAARPLPLVVISHGQGGTRLGHHDTAIALADAGFLVVTFSHPGDTFGDESSASDLGIFESRPADVSRVITHMLEQWNGRAVVDARSIGVFGFSRGGYTALALIGAKPSTAASLSRFCGSWRSLVRPICRSFGSADASLQPRADPRVRAAVVADPLNLFGEASFRAVSVPVQLWASEHGGDGVALADTELIRAWLPSQTEFNVATGAGHFVFLAPCTDEFRNEARQLCEDPKGFDRAAWHAAMNSGIIRFFRTALGSSSK